MWCYLSDSPSVIRTDKLPSVLSGTVIASQYQDCMEEFSYVEQKKENHNIDRKKRIRASRYLNGVRLVHERGQRGLSVDSYPFPDHRRRAYLSSEYFLFFALPTIRHNRFLLTAHCNVS